MAGGLRTAFTILVANSCTVVWDTTPSNPAMVAYILLLVSFPSQMTGWLPPTSVGQQQPTLSQAAGLVLSRHHPRRPSLAQIRRDRWHHQCHAAGQHQDPAGLAERYQQIQQAPEFIPPLRSLGGIADGSTWRFWPGGLLLLALGTVAWQIPTSFLLALGTCSTLRLVPQTGP